MQRRRRPGQQRGGGGGSAAAARRRRAARRWRWQRVCSSGSAMAKCWRQRGGSGGSGVSTPAASSLAAAAAAWRQRGILLTRLERGPWCAVSIVMVVSGRGDLRSEVLGLMFLLRELGFFSSRARMTARPKFRVFAKKRVQKVRSFSNSEVFFLRIDNASVPCTIP